MMNRYIAAAVASLLCTLSFAGVTVKPSPKGEVKVMNAVNNGPIRSNVDQIRDNFNAYRDCCIPYARIHDAAFCSNYGGEHTVDISAIFPDFSKDVNDPASYDFAMTDRYLATIREAGAQVFYRLGQKIEHGVRKYGIMPPTDYLKWAQICEHIIRHYNEGWADGYRWDIRYWEIWNEPDLDFDNDAWKVNPRTWGGSDEEFFKFYSIAARHLDKCFPHLRIGGPALAYNLRWADAFLAYMSAHKVPLDFFSWHIYDFRPSRFVKMSRDVRAMLDRYGYAESESILDEWNYIRDWTGAFQYSVDVINGMKGAAFVASVFQSCQDEPVDMLMYYDAQPSVYNGLFDFYDYSPQETYYAFYAWNKLGRLGTQICTEVDVDEDICATAATDGRGRTALLVSRYNDDNNVVSRKTVTVDVSALTFSEAVAHITDSSRMYTEIPVHCRDGIVELVMEPNSFVLIELR